VRRAYDGKQGLPSFDFRPLRLPQAATPFLRRRLAMTGLAVFARSAATKQSRRGR
jgi:hypothetical protein